MIRRCSVLVFLLLWLSPLAFGIIDGLCWFWAGRQCTFVDWQEAGGLRPIIVLAWTLIGTPVAASVWSNA
jgi:hypothetical protein